MTKPRYYDRDGRPIDLMEWGALFEERTYRVVKQTRLWNGVFVSTVWLGLDHRFGGEGPPLIYETMCFHKWSLSISIGRTGIRIWPIEDLFQERTGNVEEAEACHERAVKKFKFRIPPFIEVYNYLWRG